jgi:hypothetical protein
MTIMRVEQCCHWLLTWWQQVINRAAQSSAPIGFSPGDKMTSMSVEQCCHWLLTWWLQTISRAAQSGFSIGCSPGGSR